MKVEEIYVLNMALDGKDIFGLSSICEVGISELMVQSIMAELIHQQILESETSFTMQGVQIVKYMDDYKKARKYVRIDDVVLGINDESDTVALSGFGYPVEYSFEAVNIKDCYAQLCAVYPFLALSQNGGQPIQMSFDDMRERYNLEPNTMLCISSYEKNGKELHDDVLFSDGKNLFLYDKKAGALKGSFEGAELLIKERMA